MLLVKFEAFLQHELGSFNIFLVVVSIFSNLIVEICVNEFLILGRSTFALDFFVDKFLELNG